MEPSLNCREAVGADPIIAFEKPISKTSIGCQWLGRVVAGDEAGRPVLVRQVDASLVEPTEADALFQCAKAYAKVHHPAFTKQLSLVEQGTAILTLSEHLVGIRLLELMARAFRGAVQIPATVALRIVLDAAHATVDAHRLSAEAGLFPSTRLFLTEGIHVAAFGGTLLTEVGTLATLGRCQAIGCQAEVLAQLSPEEAACGSLTRGSPEVFSLGVLLWECLANQWLFSREDDRKTRDELLRLPIPSLDRVERFGLPVPESLIELVATATDRRPERRFEDLQAFVDAIEHLPTHFIGNEYQVAETVRRLAGDALSRHSFDDTRQLTSGTFLGMPPSRRSTIPPSSGPADFEPPTLAQRRLVAGFRQSDSASNQSAVTSLAPSPTAPPNAAISVQPPLAEPATPSLIGAAAGATTPPQSAGPESRRRLYQWLLALGGGGVGVALLVGIVQLGYANRARLESNRNASRTVTQVAPEPLAPAATTRADAPAPLPAGSGSAPSPTELTAPDQPTTKAIERPRDTTRPKQSATSRAYRPRQIAPYRPKGI